MGPGPCPRESWAPGQGPRSAWEKKKGMSRGAGNRQDKAGGDFSPRASAGTPLLGAELSFGSRALQGGLQGPEMGGQPWREPAGWGSPSPRGGAPDVLGPGPRQELSCKGVGERPSGGGVLESPCPHRIQTSLPGWEHSLHLGCLCLSLPIGTQSLVAEVLAGESLSSCAHAVIQ